MGVDAVVVQEQRADGGEQGVDDKAAPCPSLGSRMRFRDTHDGIATRSSPEERHLGEPQSEEHGEHEHADETDGAADHTPLVDLVARLQRGVHIEGFDHELHGSCGRRRLEELRSVEAVFQIDDTECFLAIDLLRIVLAADAVGSRRVRRDTEVQERFGVIVLEIVRIRQHLAGRLVGLLEGVLVEFAGDDAYIAIAVIIEVLAVILGGGLG